MNITERARALYLVLPRWNELGCREQSDYLVALRDLQLEIDPDNAEHIDAQMYLDAFAANIGVWIGPNGEIERVYL